jgi:RNA polymerase sigma factor (sigma-70 family)
MTAYPHNEPDVIARAKTGDKDARDQIVLGYKNMIYRDAHKFGRAYGIEIDDLVQTGYMAVMRAIDGYEPDQGYKFSTYAARAIRNAVFRCAEAVMGIPANALADLPTDKGRRSLLDGLIKGVRSLDAPIGADGDEDRVLGDVIPAHDDTEQEALDSISAAHIRALVARIPSKYRIEALTLCYGLDGNPPMAASEIAAKLGCSDQNIEQHLRHGRADLKRILTNEGYGAAS